MGFLLRLKMKGYAKAYLNIVLRAEALRSVADEATKQGILSSSERLNLAGQGTEGMRELMEEVRSLGPQAFEEFRGLATKYLKASDTSALIPYMNQAMRDLLGKDVDTRALRACFSRAELKERLDSPTIRTFTIALQKAPGPK